MSLPSETPEAGSEKTLAEKLEKLITDLEISENAIAAPLLKEIEDDLICPDKWYVSHGKADFSYRLSDEQYSTARKVDKSFVKGLQDMAKKYSLELTSPLNENGRYMYQECVDNYMIFYDYRK